MFSWENEWQCVGVRELSRENWRWVGNWRKNSSLSWWSCWSVLILHFSTPEISTWHTLDGVLCKFCLVSQFFEAILSKSFHSSRAYLYSSFFFKLKNFLVKFEPERWIMGKNILTISSSLQFLCILCTSLIFFLLPPEKFFLSWH